MSNKISPVANGLTQQATTARTNPQVPFIFVIVVKDLESVATNSALVVCDNSRDHGLDLLLPGGEALSSNLFPVTKIDIDLEVD
jgi:hypothetical protein